jgi:hypothetical protein
MSPYVFINMDKGLKSFSNMVFLQIFKVNDNEFPYFTFLYSKNISGHSIQYPHFTNN